MPTMRISKVVDLRFDFQRNRIVYMITDGRKVVDAAGRTLRVRSPNGGDMESQVILSFAVQDVWLLLWKIVLVLAVYQVFFRE